jgi:glutathione S-transferase
MKLYITPGSPYARMARVVVQEKNLEDRVEIIQAKTRTENSPYYDTNTSGRVPFLLLDDGRGFEDSGLVCRYLDSLDGNPTLETAPDAPEWELQRLESMARSMLDGISLWSREYTYRPAEIRSDFFIGHETARAMRMLDAFEQEIDNPVLTGPLNMAQLTLACTLHGRDKLADGVEWRAERPKLAAWIDRIGDRPSFASTKPPPRKPH